MLKEYHFKTHTLNDIHSKDLVFHLCFRITTRRRVPLTRGNDSPEKDGSGRLVSRPILCPVLYTHGQKTIFTMETHTIYVARDVQSTRRSSPRDRDERDRDAATTTTVYSHAHAHHHTMFTVRASAQKTTVAVDARAAKKADAKRYARTRPRMISVSRPEAVATDRSTRLDRRDARARRVDGWRPSSGCDRFLFSRTVAFVGETARRRDGETRSNRPSSSIDPAIAIAGSSRG